jgi:hypothetical protein
MTAEQGGEESPKRPPYELHGAEHQLGSTVFLFLEHLASPSREMPFAPGEPLRWATHDRLLLGVLTDIERFIPVAEEALEERKAAGQEAPGTNVDSRFPALGRFYAALPFTAAERRWLFAQQLTIWGIDGDFTWTGAFPYEERILTLGQREGIDRSDLVRRWPAWRRGADEFKDGVQLAAAEESLTELGRELLMGDLGDHPPNP